MWSKAPDSAEESLILLRNLKRKIISKVLRHFIAFLMSQVIEEMWRREVRRYAAHKILICMTV